MSALLYNKKNGLSLYKYMPVSTSITPLILTADFLSYPYNMMLAPCLYDHQGKICEAFAGRFFTCSR